MTDDHPCTLDRSDTGPSICDCHGGPGCQYAAGADVCTDCGRQDCYGDCVDLRCPCGGDCWDERPAPRPIERVTVAGELL